MASGPPTSAALAAELVALERMLHAPSVRGDVQRLANLLDEAFSEIGCSGRCYSRAQMLRHLPEDATDVNIEAECFVVTLLATGLAQVRYRSRYGDAGQAGDWAERSSLWRQQATGWRMLFHQATPAP